MTEIGREPDIDNLNHCLQNTHFWQCSLASENKYLTHRDNALCRIDDALKKLNKPKEIESDTCNFQRIKLLFVC